MSAVFLLKCNEDVQLVHTVLGSTVRYEGDPAETGSGGDEQKTKEKKKTDDH